MQAAWPLTLGGGVHLGLGLLLVVALAALLWFARYVILLIFAGLLLATFLYAASERLAALARLPRLAALPLIVLGFAGGMALLLWQAGPTLVQQLEQLIGSIAQAVTILTREIAGTRAGDIVSDMTWQDVLRFLPSPWGIASGATAVAATVFGALASATVVLFFGLYFAGDPHTYSRLAVRVVPPRHQDEALDMMHEAGHLLRRWLVGQALSMAIIGILTYAALTLLGVPLALLLGLTAGLANFVPYLGPIIAAVPMLIVASGEGMALAAWVAALYVLIQILESYLLTPLIQSRAISLPPAVVIATQLLLGALFGVIGIALATPIAAVAEVPLRRLVYRRVAG